MEMTVNQEERTEIVGVLEEAFRDVRGEIHHSHDSDEKEQLKHREKVLRGLLERFGVKLEVND